MKKALLRIAIGLQVIYGAGVLLLIGLADGPDGLETTRAFLWPVILVYNLF